MSPLDFRASACWAEQERRRVENEFEYVPLTENVWHCLIIDLVVHGLVSSMILSIAANQSNPGAANYKRLTCLRLELRVPIMAGIGTSICVSARRVYKREFGANEDSQGQIRTRNTA